MPIGGAEILVHRDLLLANPTNPVQATAGNVNRQVVQGHEECRHHRSATVNSSQAATGVWAGMYTGTGRDRGTGSADADYDSVG